MATNRYIVLQNYGQTVTKKFRVLADGYVPQVERVQTVRPTISGLMDCQVGPSIRRLSLVLKVYGTDPEASSGYGGMDDLRSLLAGTVPPQNLLYLTTPTGKKYKVVHGGYEERNITVTLDGPSAVFRVPVQFTILEETQ